MTELQKIQEWVRWYRVSTSGYQTNALLAILRNDGEKMLRSVLGELGLTDSADLLMGMDKREKDG